MHSKFVSLYEAKKNSMFLVASVPDDIELLEHIGIRAGTKIVVQNRYVLGGPVLLRVEDTYSVALGKDIAKQIAVGEVAAETPGIGNFAAKKAVVA